MPVRSYGPYKLKDKANRRGVKIANPDKSAMMINSVAVRKGDGNNVVYVDVDWVDMDQVKAE